jgi:hypothetical protein
MDVLFLTYNFAGVGVGGMLRREGRGGQQLSEEKS